MPKDCTHFTFRAYPYHFSDYHSYKIDETTSYFEFADIMLNSAIQLMDFLHEEMEREKPDFVVYSHLALWGRLIAKHYNLPAITLNTTFILDKRIMLPFFRKTNPGNSPGFKSVNRALELYRKSAALYAGLDLDDKPDLWDIYINKGELNLAFILKDFQPNNELFDKTFRFLGYPVTVENKNVMKDTIYVSMGTIMNGDVSFFRLCINVLRTLQVRSVISVGSKVDIGQLQSVPDHIKIVKFIDQLDTLHSSLLFITHGGMASVQESVYTLTPMIVVPVIPEQHMTAIRVEELGIGTYISIDTLTEDGLRSAIEKVLSNRKRYVNNLKVVLDKKATEPAQVVASELIKEFLASYVPDHNGSDSQSAKRARKLNH